MANAVFADNALLSHLDAIDSLEQPAVMADFLLRFDQVQWALVTAVNDGKLVLSLRTSSTARRPPPTSCAGSSASIGEGGGHRTKAGGFVEAGDGLAGGESSSSARCSGAGTSARVGIKPARGQKLIPKRNACDLNVRIDCDPLHTRIVRRLDSDAMTPSSHSGRRTLGSAPRALVRRTPPP